MSREHQSATFRLGDDASMLVVPLDGSAPSVVTFDDNLNSLRFSLHRARWPVFSSRGPWVGTPAPGAELVELGATAHAWASSSYNSSPRGGWLAVGQRKARVVIWRAEQWAEPAYEHTLGAGAVALTAFSEDERRVAAVDTQGAIKVWDLATGEVVARLRAGSGDPLVLSLSQDGSRLVLQSHQLWAQVWDVETGQRLLSVDRPPESRTDGAAFLGPDTLLTAGSEGLRTYRLPSRPAIEGAAALSNYRVCRDDLRLVAVVPFPGGESPWAPAAACDQGG